MSQKPKVFISYSHDSKEHKCWVAALATELLTHGINVMLDQWDLHIGSDLTQFMVNGIKSSDRVLMICTDNYVKKANARKSGVGYEGMIVTSEIYQNIDTYKFIPIIRSNSSSKNKIPDFMGERLWIDFSSDDPREREATLDDLVKDICGFKIHPKRLKESTKKDILSPSNKIYFPEIACFVFAAGKSTRMNTLHSKHLKKLVYDGQHKSMIQFCLDLYMELKMGIHVFYGFDGSSVSSHIEELGYSNNIQLHRVCSDDGSDLPANTAGNLLKLNKEILDSTTNYEHLLLTVGDQPCMTKKTITEFLRYYLSNDLDACMLTANSRGNEELEKDTFTRISKVDDEIEFVTPPKGQPFDPNLFSSILDVGVIIIRKSSYKRALQHLKESDIFGKIVRYAPVRTDGKRHIDIYEEFENLNQFKNLNYNDDLSNSHIIDDWIKWNELSSRNPSGFNMFDYKNIFQPIIEIDTTLICSTTPACSAECTYKNQHPSRKTIDKVSGSKIIQSSRAAGFVGVFFSGGGENLEPAAYKTFLYLLEEAKKNELSTHLATNGIYFSESNAIQLLSKLDSIRFSINPLTTIQLANTPQNKLRDKYSHLGILGEKIFLAMQTRAKYSFPTQIIANILLSQSSSINEIKSSILMLSALGVHTIRIKPRHIYTNGKWDVDPNIYDAHLKAIMYLRERNDWAVQLPEIIVPKLEYLPATISDRLPFEFCWYHDFNPIVVGCDSKCYACCEMKYDAHFHTGFKDDISPNISDFVRSNHKPQRVDSNKCFRGCKGYVVNEKLQKLLIAYRTMKDQLFKENFYIEEREIITKQLSRNSPFN